MLLMVKFVRQDKDRLRSMCLSSDMKSSGDREAVEAQSMVSNIDTAAYAIVQVSDIVMRAMSRPNIMLWLEEAGKNV